MSVASPSSFRSLIRSPARSARIVVATPVAPRQWVAELSDVADELIAVATPDPFMAIGRFYADFDATSDQEVIDHLSARRRTTGDEPEAGS